MSVAAGTCDPLASHTALIVFKHTGLIPQHAHTQTQNARAQNTRIQLRARARAVWHAAGVVPAGAGAPRAHAGQHPGAHNSANAACRTLTCESKFSKCYAVRLTVPSLRSRVGDTPPPPPFNPTRKHTPPFKASYLMAWRITRLSEEGRLTHEQASLAKVRGRGFRLLHAAVSAPACRVQLRGARRLQAAAGGQEAAPPTASRNSRPAWLCLRVPSGDAFYCASCVLRLPPSPPPKKHTPHTQSQPHVHTHTHITRTRRRGTRCAAASASRWRASCWAATACRPTSWRPSTLLTWRRSTLMRVRCAGC